MSSVDQKRTITLKYPLQGKDGKTVDTLQFGRMKAKQLRLVPKSFQKMYQQIQELAEELGLKEGHGALWSECRPAPEFALGVLPRGARGEGGALRRALTARGARRPVLVRGPGGDQP